MIQKQNLTPLEVEQKKESHRLRKVTLLWLSKTYPMAFNPHDPKPLKCCVDQDILAHIKGKKDVPSHRLIRRAIAYHTNGKAYHEAVLRETHRVDLAGKPVERLEKKHKDFSTQRLQEIGASLKKACSFKAPKGQKRQAAPSLAARVPRYSQNSEPLRPF